jgi:hypothetical protein
MTSIRVCGHDKPTSVAFVKEITWTDIWGTSPERRSSIVAGAEGEVARSLKSVGPGMVLMLPLSDRGSFLASSWSWVEVLILSCV